jgi:hypothetical protein
MADLACALVSSWAGALRSSGTQHRISQAALHETSLLSGHLFDCTLRKDTAGQVLRDSLESTANRQLEARLEWRESKVVQLIAAR